MTPEIDGARLLRRLTTLGQIGALEGGGVCRLALTDADKAGRDWLVAEMERLGMAVHIDAIGNIWGIRAGQGAGAPVMVGSHIDSVATGGLYDGALGVLAGLEMVETLNDRGTATEAPIAVAAFTNEEGARFAPDMMGSGVYCGALDQGEMLAVTATDGMGVVGEELDRIGYRGGDAPVIPAAYLELHIEQGPVLEQEGVRIGAVTGVQGIHWTEFTVTGQTNHAGTTPMAHRRDAFQGLSAFNSLLNDRFRNVVQPSTVWTIGHVSLRPNASSIVPGRVQFSMQWRDSSADRLDRMESIIRTTLDEIATTHQLQLGCSDMLGLAPVAMDRGLIDALAASAASHVPGKWRYMPSGALHDATNMAALMPVGMLFVPSINGKSHCFEEDTGPDDLVTGLHVLKDATMRYLAGR